jgi:hypothetical protein
VAAAFASFFVHILVAVFFPVVAGLILGLWIYAWRNVKEHFHALGDPYRSGGGGNGAANGGLLLLQPPGESATAGAVYRKLPPAGSTGTRNLLAAA